MRRLNIYINRDNPGKKKKYLIAIGQFQFKLPVYQSESRYPEQKPRLDSGDHQRKIKVPIIQPGMLGSQHTTPVHIIKGLFGEKLAIPMIHQYMPRHSNDKKKPNPP